MSTFQLPTKLSGLTPRENVLDGVYRVLQGLDTDSTEFFESGMHPDCVMKIGDQVLKGRDSIYRENLAQISKMNTSHMITNERVAFNVDGTEAQVTARALTMHYPPGEGFNPEQINPGNNRYLVSSYYQMEMINTSGQEGLWQVKRWILLSTWAEGDPNVMAA